MGTLTDIGRRFGTMKCRPKADNRPAITDTYEPFLAPWRHLPLRLLEIGIKRGASLEMWKEYFPHASIFAVDVKNCRDLADDRVEIFVGDQKDPDVLSEIVERAGGTLDLVIDDGSHRIEEQRASLLHLWPHMRAGGLYIIEDVHTSYQEKRGMGWHQPESTIEFLKAIVDDIHAWEHGRTPILHDLESVHFGVCVCILRRRVRESEIDDALPVQLGEPVAS